MNVPPAVPSLRHSCSRVSNGNPVKTVKLVPKYSSPFTFSTAFKRHYGTSPQRHRLLPEIPSFAELGYERMDISLWYGVAAPAGTPPTIVQRLNAELVQILDMPDVRKSLVDQGADIAGGTAAAFDMFMREERARWGAVVKQAGIKPE